MVFVKDGVVQDIWNETIAVKMDAKSTAGSYSRAELSQGYRF